MERMTLEEVMKELEGMGSEQTKKVLTRHGAREPFFGVKVGDMKKIVKKVKKDHDLALKLYATGNTDAMYLAGLIADETRMTKQDLEDWVNGAYWYMISEYTVPWVASETPYAMELAQEWIESDQEMKAAAGWCVLSSLVSIMPDDKLDIEMLYFYLSKAEQEIHRAPNRVRYAMNGFVISLGSYVEELSDAAMEAAEHIGKVEVEMGGTACKVPLATEYIEKVTNMGRVGKKRKTARC